MSVINQMLKDLQQRQAASGTQGVYAAARAPGAAPWWALGWAVAGLLALALAYLVWERLAPASPAVEVVAEQAVQRAPDILLAAAPVPVPNASPGTAAESAPPRAEALPKLQLEPMFAPREEPVAEAPLPSLREEVRAPVRSPAQTLPLASEAVAPVAQATSASAPQAPVSSAPKPAPSAPMERRVRPPSDAELAELAYRRGLAHVEGGRDGAAKGELHEVLARAPAHRAAGELLAALLLRAGELDEALRVLEGALRRHPADPMFAQMLARLHLQAGRPDAAIDVLERRVPAVDEQREYHALLAALYQRQGRHGEAARGYRALLQYQADHAGWWVGLAISLEGLGHRGEALEAYRRARTLGTLGRDLAHYANNRIAALEPTR